jgi:ABC-type transport system substrate-binding protein/transcriptional regulator with XRE-family HTH domain
MELGQRIAHRMRELGLTQVELARKSGLTQQVISQYIRGRSKPGYNAIAALIRALEVNSTWFFEETETEDAESDEPPSAKGNRRYVPSLVDSDEVTFPISGIGRIVRGTKLTIGHWLPMEHLPPPTQAGSAGIIGGFYSLVFNQLAECLPHGKSRGILAVDWKPIGDSWIFQLRGGVRFHDGRPLTAIDVIWSYEQYLEQNPQKDQIESIEMLDRNFVSINFKSPCRLEDIPMPFILPEGTQFPLTEWIGTGAFKVNALNPSSWELSRNPFYFFQQAYFRELQIRQFDNPATLEQAVDSDEVHFAIGIYHPSETYVAKTEPADVRYHLHFMLDRPLASNPIFRQAVALALDRGHLAEAAGLTEAMYSTGPFDYTLDDRSHTPSLPQKEVAELLLKQISELQGSTVRLRHYQTTPQERKLVDAIIAQLSELGVSAELGEPADAVLTLRQADLLESEYAVWTDTPYNVNNYSNSQVEALVQKLRNTAVTPAQLIELRRLIQKDLPDIPLFYSEIPVTYLKRLCALEERPISLNSLNEVHTWYLDQEVEESEHREVDEVEPPEQKSVEAV